MQKNKVDFQEKLRNYGEELFRIVFDDKLRVSRNFLLEIASKMAIDFENKHPILLRQKNYIELCNYQKSHVEEHDSADNLNDYSFLIKDKNILQQAIEEWMGEAIEFISLDKNDQIEVIGEMQNIYEDELKYEYLCKYFSFLNAIEMDSYHNDVKDVAHNKFLEIVKEL